MNPLRQLVLIVFLCATATLLPAEARTPLTQLHSIEGVLPDSIKLKLLATLARGDISGAIILWQTETGSTSVPKALQAFQAAFSVANRIAGPCTRIAKDIYEGFKFLGGHPEYVRISSTEGTYISWQSKILMSDNNMHAVVRYGDRLYDAFTGPAGMVEAVYLQQLHHAGELTLKTVSSP